MSKAAKPTETINILVKENMQLTAALRKFLKWFDRNERDLREVMVDHTEVDQAAAFYDLVEAADHGRSVLLGARG